MHLLAIIKFLVTEGAAGADGITAELLKGADIIIIIIKNVKIRVTLS